jgi:hypothetical protein
MLELLQIPAVHWTPNPEKLTLDVGALKLKALIVGIAPYVICALLLAVLTAFTIVDWTVPPRVAALTV